MRYIILILTIIGLLLACSCSSQITIGDFPELNTIQSIDEIAKPFVEADGTHALAIGIYENGEMSYYNYGRISEEKPVEPDSLSMFEIGSISKTFTAGILAKMVEEGKVQLDDPISKYLPDGLGEWGDELEITLEELSTHTSGLPRLPDNMYMKMLMNMDNPYSKYTDEEMYKFLKKYEPIAKSERKAEYSNLGVGLLGHILALVNETDYETLTTQYISTPLKMDYTTITLNETHQARWADGHNMSGDPTSNWDLPTFAGAGAIRSNTSDMLKYLEANLHNKLAFAATHKKRKEFGEKVDIGLGWILSTSKEDLPIIWHNGGTGGYRTFAGFSKEKDLAVVVLSNTAVSVDEVGMLLLDYLGQKK